MIKKYLAVFLLIAGIALVFWGSATLRNSLEGITLFFEEYAQENYFFSIGVFVALSVVSVIFFAFSSIWLIPIAIPIWGNLLTLALLLLGWLLGGMFCYGVGRFAGPPVIKHFISQKSIDHYTGALLDGERAFVLVLWARFMLPSEVLGYALGAVRYHFGKYFLVTLLSEVPYALIAVYAIDALIKRDIWLLGAWLAMWCLLVAAFVPMFKKKLGKEFDKSEAR